MNLTFRIALAAALVFGVAESGCSTDRPPTFNPNGIDAGKVTYVDGGTDFGRITFDIIPLESAVRDTSSDVEPDVPVGSHCVADADCGFGGVCLQGLCAADSCRTSDNTCTGGNRCEMHCVPTHDLCAGVRCTSEQTCFLGRCIAGCFPAPCAGVNCPAGQFCDETTGACAPIHHCSARCGDDYVCHLACVPRSPCDGVVCGPTELCADGHCVNNPCAGVHCGLTELCIRGHCLDTCHCSPACDRGPTDRCVVGQCVCNPHCTVGGECGASDGCAGHCIGACSLPAASCDPASYTCVCTPRCHEDTPCGASDGCGGVCASGCATGETCNVTTRRCECITHCPMATEFMNYDCGADIPNFCPGLPSCGTGMRCAMGLMCVMGRCLDSNDDGGGMEGGCGEGRMMCGMGCADTMTSASNCGSCGNVCPSGTTCVAGVCTCPHGQTLCGTMCVNTSGDVANCGACGNACGPLADCLAGVCTCVPRCSTDPTTVTCGAPVPNDCTGGPSCGTGRNCTEGSMCDRDAGHCVCVPRCPVGVHCGVSDGCGGQCIGSCDPGQTCTRDAMNDQHYFCSSAGCAGGCACNEVCSNNRCVAISCPSGSSPCPCYCCPAGQRCVGGSVCAPIPP